MKLKKGMKVGLAVRGAGVVSYEEGHEVEKITKKGIKLAAFDSDDYLFDKGTLSTGPLFGGFSFKIIPEAEARKRRKYATT
jgi:hypothetical protein